MLRKFSLTTPTEYFKFEEEPIVLMMQIVNKIGLLDIEPDMFIKDPRQTGTFFDLVSLRMLAVISMIIGCIWDHWMNVETRQILHELASKKFAYRLRRTPQALGSKKGNDYTFP